MRHRRQKFQISYSQYIVNGDGRVPRGLTSRRDEVERRPACRAPESKIDDQPTRALPPSQDGRHARGHKRQRALIDVARALFIEKGYRGTTLEAVIALAGGSRETIYRVFGGKHGLFGAIIAQAGERLAASIVAPGALSLPPEKGLHRMAVSLANIWASEEGRAINQAVLSEGLHSPELVHTWYEGGTKLSVAALARYLDAQCRAGRLQPLDAELVARQFLILLAGELAFPLIAGQADAPDRAAQIGRCVDLILRAYGVQAPAG